MLPEVVVWVVMVFVGLDYYIVGQEHLIVGMVHCTVELLVRYFVEQAHHIVEMGLREPVKLLRQHFVLKNVK